jgi:hypothetical protein
MTAHRRTPPAKSIKKAGTVANQTNRVNWVIL